MQRASQEEEKQVTALILWKVEAVKSTEQYVQNTQKELLQLQDQFVNMKDKAYLQ
jgi:hypothetical protein